ncbi:MAG TPA: gluconate 2-dehydrogenase subunit 3 family protein, partial [Longimicrobiales bacterium]|nr:gluconate 2-dehydrogenase subunit 3 family protein [Longimicrobiales bacterium]
IMMDGGQGRRDSMRTGLEWLDTESRRRFDAPFADVTDAQRRAILDDIAWPDRAPQELRRGVDWFNSMRDLTAAGFFSSKMGYDDLEFMGGPKGSWPGCPQPALDKLGVSYDVMDVKR